MIAPDLKTAIADLRGLIEGAPLLTDHLDGESQAHFAALLAGLDALGVAYEVNPRLVRGLDYYSRTVFEWVTDALGAQDAVPGEPEMADHVEPQNDHDADQDDLQERDHVAFLRLDQLVPQEKNATNHDT